MKKILSFVLAAVALVFTACSNDETIETSGNGQNNKGMVLVATVSQQSSRAAIDASETFGKWTFTFDDDDTTRLWLATKPSTIITHSLRVATLSQAPMPR
mgnify:CR=1 FL=1